MTSKKMGILIATRISNDNLIELYQTRRGWTICANPSGNVKSLEAKRYFMKSLSKSATCEDATAELDNYAI